MNVFIALFISLSGILFGYDQAELLFVGDMMQHDSQRDAARRADGRYDFSDCYTAVKPWMDMADYCVCNLETPVSRPPYAGYPCFNAPESFLDAIREAGFDMCLTANNHTLDRGPAGLRQTVDNLDARNLDHIGTYKNDSARAASLPCIRNICNIKVAFLNYTYGTNGIPASKGVAVDYIDRAVIKNDVDSARAAGAEIVAVCMHWGDEYRLLPNKTQRTLADFLEAIGVDLIIGGHPHVIQPMELRQNRYYPDRNVFIAYSLGNFISGMRTRDTRGGLVAVVRLERGDDGAVHIISAGYRMVFVESGASYRVVPAECSSDIRARSFLRSAHEVLDTHNINVPELR